MAISVKVSKILDQNDPFRFPIWAKGVKRQQHKPLTTWEVQEAIDKRRLQENPFKEDVRLRRWHIERVAYLVVNPDKTPICLGHGLTEVGLFTFFPVYDGFHRLAAAIFRDDDTIRIRPSVNLQEAAASCRMGVRRFIHESL